MESHLLDVFSRFSYFKAPLTSNKCQTLKNGVLGGMIGLEPASHIVEKNKQGFRLTILYLDHKR